MTDLAAIQTAVSEGNYQYTLHAVQRTTERHISRLELEEVIEKAEIVEEYPQDKYGPSCLLYGKPMRDEYFMFKSAYRHP